VAANASAAIAEAKRCLQCDLRLRISAVVLPPLLEEWLEFSSENVSAVPETEGVYKLLDAEKETVYIKGTMNLRQDLEEQLSTYDKAKYFIYEEEPMYTKRESELLQQFMQQYGRMPEGNMELEDLF
jgi:formate dehydrogenase beta subunit